MTDEEEPQGAGVPADHFRAWVGVLIAVASILGAVVAWRASATSGQASGLDQRSIEHRILRQQIAGAVEARVGADVRLLVDYQERIMTWRLLLQQADEVAAEDPALADRLREQARQEFSLAQGMRPLFRASFVDYGDDEGGVVYDPAFVIGALESGDLRLVGLDPEGLLAQAEEAHDRAVDMIGTGILVAVALLLLTAAQLARRGVRGIFAGAGAATLAVGGVLYVLVELAA